MAEFQETGQEPMEGKDVITPLQALECEKDVSMALCWPFYAPLQVARKSVNCATPQKKVVFIHLAIDMRFYVRIKCIIITYVCAGYPVLTTGIGHFNDR